MYMYILMCMYIYVHEYLYLHSYVNIIHIYIGLSCGLPSDTGTRGTGTREGEGPYENQRWNIYIYA
jgi:hypothetical protein